MSKFPLDLSKFKRAASSDKETTLHHDDGHKLILSHASLDQNKLKALSGLPMLAQESKLPGTQRFVDGGTAMPTPMPNDAPEQEVPAEAVPAPVAQAAPPVAAAPEEEGDDVDEPATPMPSKGPDVDQPAAPMPSSGPEKPAAPKPFSFQDFANEKMKNMEEIQKENAAITNDLSQGHIKAKTYGDLVADKGIFGKIGSIFGLMVGGAGAGLLHQENPLIGMWNNQINNDLEAQKAEAGKKQNLLSLNRQRFQDIESQVNFTKMQMNQFALHSLAHQVETLPPGSPKRVKAEQSLQTVAQFVNTDNYNIMDQIAAKQALMKNIQGSGSGEDAAFQNQQQALRWAGKGAIADQNEQHHITGVPGMSSQPIPQEKRDEITAMNVLDNKAADILNFAKAHKGTLSPAQRAIGEQKAEEMVNFYNNSIKGGVLTQGRLAWLDNQIKKNPTSIFQDILGNNARLQEIQNSNNQRRGILYKSLGFNVPQQQAQAPAPAQPQYKVYNGVKYMRGPNGESVPVK